MSDIFGELARDWDHLRHHRASQTPAPGPVTLAAAQPATEAPMQLTKIEDDVKRDLTDGLAWLEGMTGRLKAAAPGIIATAEAVGGSTVGAVIEAVGGRVLPTELEAALADMVKTFVDRFGQQPAAAAAPEPSPAAPQFAVGGQA